MRNSASSFLNTDDIILLIQEHDLFKNKQSKNHGILNLFTNAFSK